MTKAEVSFVSTTSPRPLVANSERSRWRPPELLTSRSRDTRTLPMREDIAEVAMSAFIQMVGSSSIARRRCCNQIRSFLVSELYTAASRAIPLCDNMRERREVAEFGEAGYCQTNLNDELQQLRYLLRRPLSRKLENKIIDRHERVRNHRMQSIWLATIFLAGHALPHTEGGWIWSGGGSPSGGSPHLSFGRVLRTPQATFRFLPHKAGLLHKRFYL